MRGGRLKIRLFARVREGAKVSNQSSRYPRGRTMDSLTLEAIVPIVHREQRSRNCEAVTMYGIAVVLYSTN